MASGPTTFTTLVVFSAERFQGNPLAIVAVRANSLSEKRKSLIAKEFGYSETVFIHDAAGPGLPRRLDIFTEQGEEIPFAGHPVIGAAHYVFTSIDRLAYRGPQDRDTQQQTAVFATKAGNIPVFYNPYRQLAACSVPHNFHIHAAAVSAKDLLAVQPQLQIVPTWEKIKDRTFPVASIVKGMTFALIDLTDAPEVLAALKGRSDAPAVSLDQAWAPSLVGAMFYKRTGVTAANVPSPAATPAGASQPAKDEEPVIVNLQCRMITHGLEDPGTGSASCALACWLATSITGNTRSDAGKSEDLAAKTAALKIKEPSNGDTKEQKATTAPSSVSKNLDKKKMVHHIFAIEQGVEMGRKCTIAVEVDTELDEQRDGSGVEKVKSVILSGRANFMSKGELIGN